MALTFASIPGWDSWENQGANVAVASLAKDGTLDLIVLRVDHPLPGPNRAFYRVGHELNQNGGVDGGWSDWQEIPDWGAAVNEGAGIAVADFGAAGLGLVVFQVEQAVPGPNRGLFRVGRKLDKQGRVTGGWSGWQQVPGWESWRNQGAAIAIADLDGDGAPELVVFRVDDFHGDNATRPNKGFYRVGRQLTDAGLIASWSGWVEVDWFSWFNQGAGLALADLDGDGRPEIVVFQIDAPPGENAGFYRIGWGLDAQGGVQEGWGPWVRSENWGPWENQGGGFALAAFNAGRPRAVVFQVDNPPQLNDGRFAVAPLALDTDAAGTLGIWRLLPYLSEVLPIHAALLHTGKVLFFAGSGNNVFRVESPDFGNEAKQLFTSVVWDPTKNALDPATFAHPPTLRRPNGSVIDLFCCGHTFLPDGSLLAVGGTDQYDKVLINGGMQDAGHGFEGTRDAVVFNPGNTTWKRVAPTARGRWYPTVVQLGNGGVLAASGLDENAGNNDTLERNQDPDAAAWTQTRDFGLPLYPHLFELAGGGLFFTGGKMDTEGDSVPFSFDPIAVGNANLVPGLTDVGQCNQCASVLLPPAQAQRFMILGGGPEDDTPERGRATTRTAIADFGGGGAPTYRLAAPLRHERMHVNAVLLPDRTVLAVGGGVTREASIARVVDPQGGREVFEAEIYDPRAGTWTDTAPATIARLYHSVALLLPDGRVVSAGGNPDKGSQVNWLPPDPFEEMRLEIFSPPYLFKKQARPQLTNVPAQITYGAQVSITLAATAGVQWLSLIRQGLTTHSFNVTQRLVDLPFVVSSASSLTATVPTERRLAPPGWYMLFATDTDGVPSVAKWVHLS